MKMLSIVIGLVLGYLGLSALYNDAHLARVLLPAVAAAAIICWQAIQTRKPGILAGLAGAAVAITIAYLMGSFHAGQAMGWAAGWLVAVSLSLVAFGLSLGDRAVQLKAEFDRKKSEVIAERAARATVVPSNEDPFGRAPAAPVPYAPPAQAGGSV